MRSLRRIARGKYFRLGLCFFAVYIMLCVVVLTRAPAAAAAYSINGTLAVMLSFGVLVWCGAKRCCSPLVTAVLFLMNIGMCAQCVIAGTETTRQTVLFLTAAAAGAAAVLLWDRLERLAESMPSHRALAITAGVCALLYIVLLLFGDRRNGAKAWLTAGQFSVQLTELAKLGAAGFFALLFSRSDLSDRRKVIYSSCFLALNALMLAAVNELGTLLVISFLFAAMSFLFIRSRRYTAITLGGLALIAVAGYLIIMLTANAASSAIEAGETPGAAASAALKLSRRFELWLHRDTADPNSTAYQSLRARDAIIVGGVFGSPLKVYVPYSGSDFIFPSLILRFGLLIGITVVLLFFTVFYHGIRTYLALNTPLSVAMCAACVMCMTIQALLMIFGSTNFFIMTGIPVPFLSAGGTAQVVTFIMAGLLMRFGEGMEAA